MDGKPPSKPITNMSTQVTPPRGGLDPSVQASSGPRLCIEESTTDWVLLPETLLAPCGVADLIIDNEIHTNIGDLDKLSQRPVRYIHSAPEHGLAAFFPGLLVTPVTYDVEGPSTVSTPSGCFIVHDAA